MDNADVRLLLAYSPTGSYLKIVTTQMACKRFVNRIRDVFLCKVISVKGNKMAVTHAFVLVINFVFHILKFYGLQTPN